MALFICDNFALAQNYWTVLNKLSTSVLSDFRWWNSDTTERQEEKTHSPQNHLVMWHANRQGNAGFFTPLYVYLSPHLVVPGVVPQLHGDPTPHMHRKEEAPWNNRPCQLLSETSLGFLTDFIVSVHQTHGLESPVDMGLREGLEFKSQRGVITGSVH